MNPTPTIYFFVNGIATWPGDAKNWNKRACTWIHLNTPDRAQADEYFTTALTVWIHRAPRAHAFADLLRKFRSWRIIIVAHSNGCQVALDALNLLWREEQTRLIICALHLVSGACDGNFERNGLNRAMRNDLLDNVYVYRAGKDKAMRLEDTLCGKALFGIYGKDLPLGLAGARNLMPIEPVQEIYATDYGHSTWWAGKHFEKTMRLITDGPRIRFP